MEATNGSSSFLFVNATKMYEIKTEDSEIKDYTQWLDTKNFTTNKI